MQRTEVSNLWQEMGKREKQIEREEGEKERKEIERN